MFSVKPKREQMLAVPAHAPAPDFPGYPWACPGCSPPAHGQLLRVKAFRAAGRWRAKDGFKNQLLALEKYKKINPFGCFASFSFLFRFEGKQHSKQAADTCERSLCSPKRCHKPRWWHLHPPKGGMEDQRQGDFFPWRQTCADLFSWEGSPSCHPPSHHNLTSGGPQAENARGGLWPEIKKQALETGTGLLSCSLIPRARCELSGWGTAEQS